MTRRPTQPKGRRRRRVGATQLSSAFSATQYRAHAPIWCFLVPLRVLQRLRGRESAQKTLGKTPHDADGLRAALQLRTSSLNAILAARQDWDDAFAALSEALACEQLARDMLKALQDTHLPVLASTSTLLAAQGVAAPDEVRP